MLLVLPLFVATGCSVRSVASERQSEVCEVVPNTTGGRLAYGSHTVDFGTVRPGSRNVRELNLMANGSHDRSDIRIVRSCSCVEAKATQIDGGVRLRFTFVPRGAPGPDKQAISIVSSSGELLGTVTVLATKHQPIEVSTGAVDFGIANRGAQDVARITFVSTTGNRRFPLPEITDKRISMRRLDSSADRAVFALGIYPGSQPGPVDGSVSIPGVPQDVSVTGTIRGPLSMTTPRIYGSAAVGVPTSFGYKFIAERGVMVNTVVRIVPQFSELTARVEPAKGGGLLAVRAIPVRAGALTGTFLITDMLGQVLERVPFHYATGRIE